MALNCRHKHESLLLIQAVFHTFVKVAVSNELQLNSSRRFAQKASDILGNHFERLLRRWHSVVNDVNKSFFRSLDQEKHAECPERSSCVSFECEAKQGLFHNSVDRSGYHNVVGNS